MSGWTQHNQYIIFFHKHMENYNHVYKFVNQNKPTTQNNNPEQYPFFMQVIKKPNKYEPKFVCDDILMFLP